MTTASDRYFVEILEVGPLPMNAYILGCVATSSCLIIDPGDDPEIIISAIVKRAAQPVGIVLTHGHYDHLGAVSDMKQHFTCSILIHELEKDTLTNPMINLSGLTGENITAPAADRLLHDGDEIAVGELRLKVLHTPGHSAGSISLHFEEGNILFCGDLIFAGSIGRTDLPGGSFEEIERSIRRKVYTLPNDTTIYPGHGEPTTVATEKRTNPFVREA
jgi:glyoxylase-like metal-dependent hydrolase (beta-lactamase superfamily II)